MPHSSVTFNIFQALDIARDFTLQVSLDAKSFDMGPDAILFLGRELSGFFPERYCRCGKNLLRSWPANAKNCRESNLKAFSFRHCYSKNSHIEKKYRLHATLGAVCASGFDR